MNIFSTTQHLYADDDTLRLLKVNPRNECIYLSYSAEESCSKPSNGKLKKL